MKVLAAGRGSKLHLCAYEDYSEGPIRGHYWRDAHCFQPHKVRAYEEDGQGLSRGHYIHSTFEWCS